MDFFGNIAAKGIGGRQEFLVKNEPQEFKENSEPVLWLAVFCVIRYFGLRKTDYFVMSEIVRSSPIMKYFQTTLVSNSRSSSSKSSRAFDSVEFNFFYKYSFSYWGI